MPSVLPTDQQPHQYTVFKLKAGYTEQGVTPGYTTLPSDNPYYQGEAQYVLGSNGNTVAVATVTISPNDPQTGGNTATIDYGNGNVVSFPISREFSSNDPNVVIVQSYTPVSVPGGTDFFGNPLGPNYGSDHDWYMFANSSADVSKYVGKTITHYYGGWRRPDIYTLDNLRFTEENIPGGTNNNPNNPNPTKPFKPCYLAGSLIRTPRGDVPVETLKEGDTVLTYQNGKAEEHPLRWVGKKHLYVRPNAHNGFVDYPVCIKKDALADGVPSQDLFVTPEHCMFLNGMFIPVRMLVNGVSIAYQEDVTEYDIYHIETEEHAVVWANDALSETYLDTGSRKMFNVVAQINAHSSELSEQYVKTWERDAAAPLETSRNVVEPVWQEIAQRAGVHYSTPATVNDPDLHLVTEAGDVIRPYRVRNDHYLFHLPENIDQVQLISRTARPSEVIGPFVDDRRNLGVLIDDIRLFQRTDYTEIEAPFHDASLPGWDVMEESHCRWTNGAALLPVERSAVSRVLSVHILQAGPYLASTEGKEGPFQDTVSASLLRA